MILAQAFGEYGAITSIVPAVDRFLYEVSSWLRAAGLGTWLILGVAGIVVLRLLFGKKH